MRDRAVTVARLRDNARMRHESDEVDRIVDAWMRQRPDLDFSPLEVLSRVDRLSRHLDRARREAFRRSDLEPWEWDVLSALRRAGEPYQLSPKQLLQQTLVSSGTMTNRIDRLVGRRLVRREADPGDGRSVLVTLSDDGRIRVDAAITRLVDAEAELLAGLSRSDRDRLAALVGKLCRGFDGCRRGGGGNNGRMPLPSRLPVRDGVGATRLRVPRTGPWATIADHIAERFWHVDPERLYRRFDRGEVVARDGSALSRSTPLGAHDFVWYYREPPVEREIPFDVDVLHQDDELLVVDKPHFLPTTPGGGFLRNSALVRLRVALDNPHLTPIHRLDRSTAGVLLFSARPATRGAYQSMFEQRTVAKVYEAVSVLPASGLPELPPVVRTHIEKFRDRLCVVQDLSREPNAETRVELLAVGASGGTDAGRAVVHTLLRPHTGRMHQLRAHLASIGLGILHDRYYPTLLDEEPDDFARPLQLLAREISFTDPLTGEPRRFTTRLRLSERPVDSTTLSPAGPSWR